MGEGRKGLFIVLYGSNNVGKSVQLDLLEEVWRGMDRPCVRQKWPIYKIESGRKINGVLREGVEMEEQELQWWFAQNRRDFEQNLKELLREGDVLGEDYVGTGKAWGITRGVGRDVLEEYNKGLLRPDVEVLLHARKRFLGTVELRHRNEDDHDGRVWRRNRDIHLRLAVDCGWHIVNANQVREKVHADIMVVLEGRLEEKLKGWRKA